MDTLLNRFCRYVQVDTQADERAATYPSSPGQMILGRLLHDELLALGLEDVVQDEHGIVLATIPATVQRPVPTVAFIAHLDTSPETTGRNVRPIVHRNYDGRDIVLPGDPSKVLRVAENPELAALVGKTIITTDGTTLLGGDDKAGVAAIMEAAGFLTRHLEIPHGPIRICFTCDEEIGRGVQHLTLEKLKADVAYTLDGGSIGELDEATFSADLATVTITGINCHPGYAKDRMINALRLAGMFLERLPRATLAPETTEGRQGFLHPYRIEGGVGEVVLKVLLRDFDTPRLADHATLLRQVAATIMAEYPRANIDVALARQYRNLADGLGKDPRALTLAEEAMRRVLAEHGRTPKRTIIRGGTDGAHLTEMGLPTPNISTGEHNIHSPLEWVCLEELEIAMKTVVEIARVWAEER